ncbi:TetR/AcrR family transcriptional regulator [Gulosibacter sp. ACHW.36C]|uniref:TetR/AcrR family transcriptional regulator n=1 Tax=Gulosibacter sediminis TaxID=1729695 RepID=A0ABY4N0A1_9MICO|nr:TetR/AcrR family transcriptional regulator [Gulosibacter sediminis]UQN15694.1 TetR/AcrR family transcriptional regulator [Gulosibacter sediminis]
MQNSISTGQVAETAPAPGLRERQRLESLKQIHEAARDLVEANGFAATTIAAIAERAGVSRRTFFNYYATKEDAVLGLAETIIPAEAIDEFFENQQAGDRLARIVVLLARTALNMRQSGTSRKEVHRLATSYPELQERMHQRFQEIQDKVAELALDKLDQLGDVEKIGEDGADAQALSEAMITLAGAVLKYSFRRNPDILDNPTREAFEPTIRAFRTALKEVQ